MEKSAKFSAYFSCSAEYRLVKKMIKNLN